MPTQHVNTTPGVPDEVVKKTKQVKSQEGEPEPTGKPFPNILFSLHYPKLWQKDQRC
jgi:hypothetical protein